MERAVKASCIGCENDFEAIIEVGENLYVDSLWCSECGSNAFVYGVIDENVQRLYVRFNG